MPTTVTFVYTGAQQSITVPAGVTSLTISASGAGGNGNGGAAGGAGGLASGDLAVTGGEVIYVYVGGAGAVGGAGVAGAGGFNGGGPSSTQPAGVGGGGGGGASDIRQGGTGLANRKLVAGGGGGGSGGGVAAGQAGGTTGSAGTAGGGGTGGGGGGGGTQSAGGAAGAAGASAGTAGTAGASGQGGQGGSVTSNTTTTRGGGGGGGGYFGGGGGGGNNAAGTGGGGGGGSSYTGGVTSGATTAGGGAASGQNGSVTITYNQPPNAPALTTPTSGNYVDPSLPLTLGWTFSDPDTGDAQTAASVQYRVLGAGSWTDLQLISTPSTVQTATIPAGMLTAGNTYEWRVATSDGTATGPYSTSAQFTAANPPAAPTITAPISQLSANPAAVNWTTPGAQVAYQVRFVADNGSGTANTAVVYSDTGGVSSSSHTASVGLGTAINGGSLHVQVRHQQNPGLWSAWADSGVETINVGQPGVPTLALTGVGGAITVAITNPSTPNPTVSNDLYRTDVNAIDLRTDWTQVASVPAAADSLQPLQLVTGQPLPKIQAGTLAMSYTGSGAQRLDLQYQTDRRVNRIRAEFEFESAGWTTDGAQLGLFALVSPYAGGTVPDSHCYLTIGRTSWGLAYVSGGTLTSLLTGSYSALPLDTLLAVEVAVNPYTSTVTIWLPDGSVKTITNTVLAAMSGVVVDAVLLLNAANTDRRPRLFNLWASGQVDFGELRIATGLAPNASYTDYTPGSGKTYRYRAQAYAFFGGTSSSA